MSAESKLIPCPECTTMIEPWQVTCHQCGFELADSSKTARESYHIDLTDKQNDFPPDHPKFDTTDISAADQEEVERLVPGSDTDRLWAQLYCPSCGRILLESQVYSLRKGRKENFRCFCGFEGLPFVDKEELLAKQSFQSKLFAGEREKLMSIAQRDYPTGRKQNIAKLLAIIGGGIGLHKFYLGENFAGFSYLIMCWTLLPLCLSMIDAIHLWHMSRISFNLAYNMDLVFRNLPPDELDRVRPTHLDAFVMESASAESGEDNGNELS